MTIYIIEFWRKGMSGSDFCSCKPFQDEFRARKYLRLNGYNLMHDEENVYFKSDMRAIVTERIVE